MRSRWDGGIPGPESTTSTLADPLPEASRSSILPPSGVQWNAFESRFEITCSTRSPSETITGGSPFASTVYSMSRRRASSANAP